MSSDEYAQITSQFRSLERKADGLRDDANLTDISRELGELTGDVTGLPGRIEGLRRRGYTYAAYLEHKAEVLRQRWDPAYQAAQRAIESEVDHLRGMLEEVDQVVRKAQMMEAKPPAMEGMFPAIESAIETLENATEAATARIEAQFRPVAREIKQTGSQIDKIEWYLEQQDEASFDFLAGEALFLAAEAEWAATGKGRKDPDGILYLTDQRLLFEQKEKTGKRLGMFGGQLTQELEWEIPLNQIEGVTAEKQGMFGGKDMLNFSLSGGDFDTLTVEVKGGVDCKFWAAQIKRMISGETDDERAIEPDEELLESIREAPTACPVCGATLPLLVAGQRQIECGFCGAVVRL
ncbi:MAG: hypothetical protein GYB67_15280 [Chloroflexi bacterium]|nr:hypothetical protein [Chloroflexota bacterium]